MKMKKITPIFVVDQIEPCLDFWVNRLGFEKTVEIPEGGSLGFVILIRGNVEVMYQSRASVENDLPGLPEPKRPAGSPNAIYIEVSDIEDTIKRLEGTELAVPKRTTFYGATEIGVREPAGNLIIFAQMSQ
jgi:hypothetical protein